MPSESPYGPVAPPLYEPAGLAPPGRRLTPMQALRSGLRHWGRFEGRATRSEYIWMSVLAYLPWGLFVFFMGTNLAVPQWFGAVYLALLAAGFVMVIPAWSVAVRRVHDVGQSGWLVFLAGVVGLGFLVILALALIPGTARGNRYGPNPRFESGVPPEA